MLNFCHFILLISFCLVVEKVTIFLNGIPLIILFALIWWGWLLGTISSFLSLGTVWVLDISYPHGNKRDRRKTRLRRVRFWSKTDPSLFWDFIKYLILGLTFLNFNATFHMVSLNPWLSTESQPNVYFIISAVSLQQLFPVAFA